MMELDMQYGLVRGRDAYRVSTPDFELDLGITSSIELDIDGELAVGGPDTGAFVIDRWAPDNLWTSIKAGLLDFSDPVADIAWTSGIQLGPKLPLARGNQGVGVEGLLLLGCRVRKTQAVVNLGGLIDPAGDPHTPRPKAVEGGLGLDRPLVESGRWSITAELGGVRYFSPDTDQLTTTIGITFSPTETLDLSLVGLRGWLAGGDRWGVLFGISPKVQLW